MAFLDFFRKQQSIAQPQTSVIKGTSLPGFAFNLSNDMLTPELTIHRSSSTGYQFGSDNLYPQDLIKLLDSSAIHSAILTYKRNNAVGKGYSIEGFEYLSAMEKIEINQLTNQFDQFYKDTAMDYFVHSQIFVKVLWNADNTKILKVEYLPSESIRIDNVDTMMKPTEFLYCYDWTMQSRFPKIKFAAFNQMDKVNKSQILMFQNRRTGSKIYTKPSYISGLNHIILDSEFGYYNKAVIQNSCDIGLIVQLFNVPANSEEQQQIMNNFHSTFAGAKRARKPMLVTNESNETGIDITQLENLGISDSFIELGDKTQKYIAVAHNIDPRILGLETPGSLGNSNELEIAYNKFQNNIIEPAQYDLERFFNTIMSASGISSKIKFNKTENQYIIK